MRINRTHGEQKPQIKIILLSLKTECLHFTFESLHDLHSADLLKYYAVAMLLQLRKHVAEVKHQGLSLRACRSYRSSGGSIVIVSLPGLNRLK